MGHWGQYYFIRVILKQGDWAQRSALQSHTASKTGCQGILAGWQYKVSFLQLPGDIIYSSSVQLQVLYSHGVKRHDRLSAQWLDWLTIYGTALGWYVLGLFLCLTSGLERKIKERVASSMHLRLISWKFTWRQEMQMTYSLPWDMVQTAHTHPATHLG